MLCHCSVRKGTETKKQIDKTDKQEPWTAGLPERISEAWQLESPAASVRAPWLSVPFSVILWGISAPITAATPRKPHLQSTGIEKPKERVNAINPE